MIKWKRNFGLCPVEFYDKGWYFWNETYSQEFGPYPNHIEAWASLKEYCEELERR